MSGEEASSEAMAHSGGADAGSAVAADRSMRGGPLRVLRRREFALFWVGQSISLVGTWVQAFAQGWVVVNLTESAFAPGLVNFFMSLPALLLMPFGGVAADRLERRRILIWANWALLLLAAMLGMLVATGQLRLWHVYLVALPLGIAMAYELPAYQSFYPQLVERDELPQAISLNQATFHGSRIIGPALAGWLVALWGTAAAFFANALSFLAVIVALSFIRPRPAAAGGGRASPWLQIGEGLRYVRDRPRVQAILGLTGITTFFVFPNLAVLVPFYVKHVLGVGPGGLGAMMAASGAGALLGAILLLTLPAGRRVGRIATCAGTMVVALSVLAWSRQLWLSVAAVAFLSFAIAQSMGIVSIMLQEMVPEALRGRVMSLYSLMFMGVMPFAALLMTGLATGIGMRRELQIAAILFAAGGALAVWGLRRGERGTRNEEPQSRGEHGVGNAERGTGNAE